MMFLRLLSLFIGLVWLVHCNKGKVDLERCGCFDQGNRSRYVVEARVHRDQLGDFLRRITELRERGGASSYDSLEVDGVCSEMDTGRVVFCAEDRRDYTVLEEEFVDVNFTEERVD